MHVNDSFFFFLLSLALSLVPSSQALAEDLAAQQAALGAHPPPEVSTQALREVVETSLKPYKAMVGAHVHALCPCYLVNHY